MNKNQVKITSTKRATKIPPIKMSQIDYKIELLERIGLDAELSQVEKNQLNSLKERKVLMAMNGIENKATIVPKFPPRKKPREAITEAQTVNEVESTSKSKPVIHSSKVGQGDVEQNESQHGGVVDKSGPSVEKKVAVKKKCRQGFSNPFLHFVHKNKMELNNTSPGARVTRATLMETWKKMDEVSKKEFYDKSEAEKLGLGSDYRKNIKENALSTAEKKQSRSMTNRKHHEKLKKERELKIKEGDALVKDFEDIVSLKETKLKEMIVYVEGLKLDVVKTQTLNKEVAISVAEKDTGCLVVKEQYKALHKIHKNCQN